VQHLVVVLLAYYAAGWIGQVPTTIRSGNLGPVWPAYGIALSAVLAFGRPIWPALFVSAFVVAYQSPVFFTTAIGQAAGATLAALTGAFLLRKVHGFDPTLPRLRDAVAFIVLGAFGSAVISASIGVSSIYATRLEAYSGMSSAWLIYWLGDATGALLVTPLVFTVRTLFDIRTLRQLAELATLLTLLSAACWLVFGDLPLFTVRLHALAFAVMPFVMWAAIGFGVAGAALAVLLIATIATLFTAFGLGPFSVYGPFVNAALLDVLFGVLAVSGLSLASVIAERKRAEREREALIRSRTEEEARLRLAAIVESSSDAVLSTTLDGTIQSWNGAAQRIFGFTKAEAVGQRVSILHPARLDHEETEIVGRLLPGSTSSLSRRYG
jgi:integral membrane sensor domain MASE1